MYTYYCIRRDEGLDFMKFSVYLLIMSCLCSSHYSTCLAKAFLSWNKLFYVIKYRFCGMLHHPKVFISVKLPVYCGTFAFFLAIFFRRQFFPDVRWLLLQITC